MSTWRERIDRRKKWDAKSEALKKESSTIVRLIDTPIEGTHAEVASERLARWQRAAELYVYCPEESGVDFMKLLEKLIEGCGEENELLEALSHSSQICTTLVEQTSLSIRDAAADMAEAEDAYHIKLEAHTMLADRAAEQTEKIEQQFRINGQAALKIGQRLEMAEAMKRQFDTAAELIRQWWKKENLAEHEGDKWGGPAGGRRNVRGHSQLTLSDGSSIHSSGEQSRGGACTQGVANGGEKPWQLRQRSAAGSRISSSI